MSNFWDPARGYITAPPGPPTTRIGSLAHTAQNDSPFPTRRTRLPFPNPLPLPPHSSYTARIASQPHAPNKRTDSCPKSYDPLRQVPSIHPPTSRPVRKPGPSPPTLATHSTPTRPTSHPVLNPYPLIFTFCPECGA
ncbi:hypothetical protein WJX73_007135 [Symbiochloris irregularis]|uniref:Uncharacterized protein n=1 Tax=Symbiochloris irregularis TaxID=706552 RepID=A0AAW1P1K4_9CHLO